MQLHVRWSPVKRDIVLGHELIVSDVFRVLPPLLPVISVVGRNADVPNGSVKPDIENLQKRKSKVKLYDFLHFQKVHEMRGG